MEKEKKLKIVLACALGMSSSVLVNRIRKAAQQEGIEVECEACSVNMVEEAALDADCLLLGPQADFLLESIREKFPGIPVDMIYIRDYGTMNGAKVLAQALSLIRNK